VLGALPLTVVVALVLALALAASSEGAGSVFSAGASGCGPDRKMESTFPRNIPVGKKVRGGRRC
jgi:hypothetical protein